MVRTAKSRRQLVSCILTLAAFSLQAAAQEVPTNTGDATKHLTYRARLLGVYDDRSGDPVEGADVVDVMSGTSARTTSTGTVALAFLPDGGGLVRIRKVGFEPQTFMVLISPADTVPLTIVLKHVVELAAMVAIDSSPRYTSPGLRGFEERRRMHQGGYFIPEAQIRKEEGRKLGNALLAHFPGLTIKQGRQGQMSLAPSQRCGKGGPPRVLLDGVLISNSGGPVNLDDFDLTTLAGIEYYPTTGTGPVEFNTTSTSCGALLLWSRQ
jgi:hypothetical protein